MPKLSFVKIISLTIYFLFSPLLQPSFCFILNHSSISLEKSNIQLAHYPAKILYVLVFILLFCPFTICKGRHSHFVSSGGFHDITNGSRPKICSVKIGRTKGAYYERALSDEWLFVGTFSLLEEILHSSIFNALVFPLILQCRNTLIQPIVYLYQISVEIVCKIYVCTVLIFTYGK